MTVSDSVVSLATNLTKNYTFTDPASGQSVGHRRDDVALFADRPVGHVFGHRRQHPRRLGRQRHPVAARAQIFSASLVSASSGVTAGSVAFGITGLGIRPVQSGGDLTWTSSVAGLDITYTNGTEVVQSAGYRGYFAERRDLFRATAIPHRRLFPALGCPCARGRAWCSTPPSAPSAPTRAPIPGSPLTPANTRASIPSTLTAPTASPIPPGPTAPAASNHCPPIAASRRCIPLPTTSMCAARVSAATSWGRGTWTRTT